MYAIFLAFLALIIVGALTPARTPRMVGSGQQPEQVSISSRLEPLQ